MTVGHTDMTPKEQRKLATSRDEFKVNFDVGACLRAGEKGKPVQTRRCPRNCKRLFDAPESGHWETGTAGVSESDTASQETCQRSRRPTCKRGVLWAWITIAVTQLVTAMGVSREIRLLLSQLEWPGAGLGTVVELLAGTRRP